MFSVFDQWANSRVLLRLHGLQSSDAAAAAAGDAAGAAVDAVATVPLEPLGWMPPDLIIQAIDYLCSVTGTVLEVILLLRLVTQCIAHIHIAHDACMLTVLCCGHNT
jgi:hypothetical protein